MFLFILISSKFCRLTLSHSACHTHYRESGNNVPNHSSLSVTCFVTKKVETQDSSVAYIERQVEIKKKQLLVKKSIEPVVTKEYKPTAAETEAPCPKCGHDKAYFKSMQIRSADEPESRFYRYLKCEFTWREE